MNFHDLLKSKLLSMNLREELLSLGRADVETKTRQKEPDQSYLLSHLPPGRTNKWPCAVSTLALTTLLRYAAYIQGCGYVTCGAGEGSGSVLFFTPAALDIISPSH